MIMIIGLLAGILTTISLVPQVIKIICTKDTTGISLETYLITIIGVLLWLTYGIMIKELPIVISSGVSLIFSSIIFIMLLKNKKTE